MYSFQINAGGPLANRQAFEAGSWACPGSQIIHANKLVEQIMSAQSNALLVA